MIEVIVRLECDTCGRFQTVTVSKLHGPVDVPVIVASCRWGQFLNGPTLCPECVQNHGPDQEAVARAARIHLAAAAKQEATEGRPQTNGHATRPVLPVLSDRPARKAPPRYKLKGMTGQEVLDIVNSSKTKAEAARKIGVSYTGIIARMRAIRDKVVPAIAILMVSILLASCSTRGLDSPKVAPKKPQEREVVFPPIPSAPPQRASRASFPAAVTTVADQVIRLEFDDVPDGRFRVEASKDLRAWSLVQIVQMPAIVRTNEAGVIFFTFHVTLDWSERQSRDRLFVRLTPIEPL